MTTFTVSDIEAYFLCKICDKISQRRKDMSSLTYKTICDSLEELSMTIAFHIDNDISFDDIVTCDNFLQEVFNPSELPFI